VNAAEGEPLWLRAGGKRLEARQWLPAGARAPSVVLLHEGLGSVSLWRDFPARLAEATGRGVLAYSRAGYGRSDPVELPRPLDYMRREARDVLPDLLAGLSDFVLIGHSDGASIAAIYAGEVADDRLAGLVLIAPHFFTEAPGLASIEAAREAWETTDLRARLARHHADPDNAFRGWNDAWLDPDFRNWNIEAAIPGIRAPVLAVQGEDDQYGTLAQLAALKRGLRAPYSEVVIEECRHAPHVEQPGALLAAVARFIAGL